MSWLVYVILVKSEADAKLVQIPHAQANSWPLLVLGGATETHNSGKEAFQDVDQVSMIKPLAKLAQRPPYPDMIPKFINDAYRTAMFGRPGGVYVDLPADLIMGHFDVPRNKLKPITEAPLSCAPEQKIRDVVEALKSAKAPIVVIGKGAAYARAENQIRKLIAK